MSKLATRLYIYSKLSCRSESAYYLADILLLLIILFVIVTWAIGLND